MGKRNLKNDILLHMNTKDYLIGELVAQDYRSAAVFEKYGIDFCCKGNVTLTEVCDKKGIDIKTILEDLEKIKSDTNNQDSGYNSWSLDLLTDYIEKKHHKYVEEKIPIIKQYLEKICVVHGNQHPELFQIKELFSQSAGELAVHMKKEELVLFPYIRKMVATKQDTRSLFPSHFGTVKNPINMMKHEHDREGDIFRRIAELSDNYIAPADACNTYKVAFAMLKEFEADLHLHIHLENNILFPKSIELEKEVIK